MKFHKAFLFLLALGGTASAEEPLLERAKKIFSPLPKHFGDHEYPLTKERVDLGRMLFFDPRASADGTISCASCHAPALYGTDALPASVGAWQRKNQKNAPTVLNAAISKEVHWIGDRKGVEDQATRFLVGKNTNAQPDFASAMRQLLAIPGYRVLFAKAFPGDPNPINEKNYGAAVGAFERTLSTPGRFDTYLDGEEGALSKEEKKGLAAFIDMGCVSCHFGPGVGGAMFQKFGVFEDYWKATGSKVVDNGREAFTHKEKDRYVFKVPSLRNVAMTPPYFHDGSVATLEEAVSIMARVQLKKTPSAEETKAILAFLQALTGELPPAFREAPVLPPAAAFLAPAGK